ncbi:hypothetical protein ElyMa_005619900 [Elysia marginata]|uniref:Uncharacterized protein n=1 Tax=Elysia marginata TaxID=1093978 RepID=A0AAV4F9L8_9GAST|nr:hypothetical protein ElyMa_005619900 [Elysia marginata]
MSSTSRNGTRSGDQPSTPRHLINTQQSLTFPREKPTQHERRNRPGTQLHTNTRSCGMGCLDSQRGFLNPDACQCLE